AALEAVVRMGCTRALSSDGQASAMEGAAALAERAGQAAGRLQVMAGAGLIAANIAEVARRSGCRELHASGKRLQASRMRRREPVLPGLAIDHVQTDAGEVRALRVALDAMD